MPRPVAKPVRQTVGDSSRPRVPPRSKTAPPPTPAFSFESDEMMLREDFSKTIKNARETLGITQEDLGRKISVKPSVISHLEVGSLKPDDLLARKLEHFLKIELFVPIEDELSTDSP